VITIEQLSKQILTEKRVALICHVRPDGDTLGSALALSGVLNNLGVSTEVVCDDPVPSRFLFLNEAKQVKNAFNGTYSALIAIDCADLGRLGSFADEFTKHKNTYVIDHHVSNTRFAKINYVVTNASNAENVFELIKAMNGEITESVANLLATGISTDTGNFRHKNVTANTLKTASILVEKGADLNRIYYYMFSVQSKGRAKLFGITMSKIRYFEDGRFAVASVLSSDITASGASSDETEGFIDFVMGIRGVEVGACVLETGKNKYKISFRSHSVDVNAVASSFGGGGHTLASGCQIQGEYEEVVDKIRFAVSRELPE
jgi:phosphoesterase RecJ-like protein